MVFDALPLTLDVWIALSLMFIAAALVFIVAGLTFKRYAQHKAAFVLNLAFFMLLLGVGYIFTSLNPIFPIFENTVNLLLLASMSLYLNFILVVFYHLSKKRQALAVVAFVVAGMVPITLIFFYRDAGPGTLSILISVLDAIVAIPILLGMVQALKIRKRVDVEVKRRLKYLAAVTILYVGMVAVAIMDVFFRPYKDLWHLSIVGVLAILLCDCLYVGFVRKQRKVPEPQMQE